MPETYGVTFPNSLFDGTDLTAVAGAINVSVSSPGATFTSPATANLIGIAFANPTTAAWPNLATAQADQVDMDVDSHPGVTATPKTGTPASGNAYANPPLALSLFFPRADSLYMALRSVMTLNGTLTSCTAASGAASIAHMDDHIIGCHVAGGGACTATQISFVDGNSPVLMPRTGANAPTFSAVKLTTAASCPNVRAAIP